MSHNVESMFYAGAVPWHGFGTKVDEAQTSADAIQLAGLDWLVEKQSLFVAWGGTHETMRGAAPNFKAVNNGLLAIVRQTDGEVVGTSKAAYVPWQNHEAFTFMDSLFADGVLTYSHAGSLQGGRLIWLLAKMQANMEIDGDVHERYLLLKAGHDAGIGIQMMPTDVTVVCNNTLDLAILRGERGSHAVSISHTSGMHDRLEAARNVLAITDKHTAEMKARLEQLQDVSVHRQSEADIAVFNALFDDSESTASKNKKAAYRKIFEAETERNGTNGYAMVQAITGYVDHARTSAPDTPVRAERRFRSVLDGSGHSIKKRAVKAMMNVLDLPSVVAL